MRGIEADLVAFYDQEAAVRSIRELDPERVRRRGEFIDLLANEGARRVVEVGCGPGVDAAAFGTAGIDVIGFDLSIEHAHLAAGRGVAAARASLFALPIERGSCDAGWTMSTLVHVPDERFHDAMTEITAALRDGAVLAVGLWGGLDHEAVSEEDQFQPPRFFSVRSHKRARSMLARHGTIERFDTWTRHAGRWEYQFAVLRVHHDPTLVHGAMAEVRS